MNTPLSTYFYCPKCGGPANDVEGNPLERPRGVVPIAEMTILLHCEQKHAWFEQAYYDATGRVFARRTASCRTKEARDEREDGGAG